MRGARARGRMGGGRRGSPDGQSLAEFALVLPVMILILVAVADFARVFTALITVEAAARNAAEITAQEYLRTIPTPLPNPGDPGYYEDLYYKAGLAACAETRSLPNTDYDTGTGHCPTWPVVRVCVHDDIIENQCGNQIQPAGSFRDSDPNCPQTAQPMDYRTMTSAGSGSEPSRYVEVRLCYRFTMLLRIPPLPFGVTPPIGDIMIERSRTFTVADY